MDYAEFIQNKSQLDSYSGFEPLWIPSFLEGDFAFQASLVDWSLRKGKSALFVDTGLGKTPMQLVWAENVVRHTNKPVLILTPLAVSFQTVREAEKFGIDAKRSSDGTVHKNITVTNYQRLHYFDPNDFAGCVCDESGCLKDYDSATSAAVIEFARKMPYRLLATATAAPNDYIELGTSSEALGELGYIDMLQRFFKNDQHTVKPMRYTGFGNPRSSQPNGHAHTDKWRFKGHAEIPFWQWVSSWARALRKPSDLGFSDDRFMLPPLTQNEYVVVAKQLAEGMFFSLEARGLKAQREERRRTINERCEKVAELVNDTGQPAIVWAHLNPEGDLLEKLIPDCVQISGKDSDDAKEEKFLAFMSGQARVLNTKPKIGAWGLNLQHCAHMTFFPSHSFEQLYQGIRRCWRFCQTRPVTVDIVTTEGEQAVMINLLRKAKAADKMFDQMLACMTQATSISRNQSQFAQQENKPAWL